MQEKPIITPADWLAMDGIGREDGTHATAVVAFCPLYAMKRKAQARQLAKPIFTHLDPQHQFSGVAHDRAILMGDCVYGGPVCATVIEEMAHLGVKYAVGYGYAGSLRKDLRPGTIVLATSGFASDGTSREYTESDMVLPGSALLRAYEGLARPVREGVAKGKAWTTDALYREYPSKVRSWREVGADFVNMDTSHFYAVSRAVGIDALCFSVISDYVGDEHWEQEFGDIRESLNQLHDIVLKLVSLAE